MSGLKEFNEMVWEGLLDTYRIGLMRKEFIVAALRDGLVPPPEALPMIADVIEGTGKALDNRRLPVPPTDRWLAVKTFHELERWIAAGPDNFREEIPPGMIDFLRQQHKRTKYDHRSDGATANQIATKLMCDHYGVGRSTLAEWKRQFPIK